MVFHAGFGLVEMMIIMMMIMSTARWCDLGASGCLCLPVCGHHRAFVVIIRIIEIIVIITAFCFLTTVISVFPISLSKWLW